MRDIYSKEHLLEIVTKQVIEELSNKGILTKKTGPPYVPVSISARHIHLQKDHIDVLFGEGYQLTKFKKISQPGQYACKEQVTISGPRGEFQRVRVLGPARRQTQVEISATDARKLGLQPPVRNSGDLQGSSPITIIGPKGKLHLEEGCIIADRHIHMTPEDAKMYGVEDKQTVSVLVKGPKGGRMDEVKIRVHPEYALDMHIDTDDANAFGLRGDEWLELIP